MRHREDQDLNKATETEKSLSVALITAGAGIFAGACAFWFGAYPFLTHAGQVSSTIICCLILGALGLSFVFGGRGIVYGPGYADWRDNFNLQALTGALALVLFIALATIMIKTSERSANEKFDEKITELQTYMKTLERRIDGVSSDLSDLQRRSGSTEKTLADLDRLSSTQADKIREFDNSLKLLSQKVEKLGTSSGHANE